MGSYSTRGLLESTEGGSSPRLNVFNITCWHHGSFQPHPAPKLQFGMVRLCLYSCWCERWRVEFMCAFGRPALSDVAMEEVCCRFVRCRRRTSSLTLTLPRSKLVRLENRGFGFLLEQSGHPVYIRPPAQEMEMKPSCLASLENPFLTSTIGL